MDGGFIFCQEKPGERRRPMAVIRLFSSMGTGYLLAAITALFQETQELFPEHNWAKAFAVVMYCGMAERPVEEKIRLRGGQEVIIFDLLRNTSELRTLDDYRNFIINARNELLQGKTVDDATAAAWHGPLCGVTRELYTLEAAQAEIADLAESLRAEGYLAK